MQHDNETSACIEGGPVKLILVSEERIFSTLLSSNVHVQIMTLQSPLFHRKDNIKQPVRIMTFLSMPKIIDLHIYF
jgi:hypothetical protein